jgi:hypothetical protein
MAKGGPSIGGGGGGILGSGIFGFFGTTIRCDSTDNSTYCNVMKLFNLLIVFFVVAYILYIVYNLFIAPAIRKRR